MRIEVAKHARMSERGSSLLRLIQNNETPVLDLLVRESVQNSLDASTKEHGHVNVDFNVTDFDSENVNRHFEGIEDRLNEKFPKGTYKLLSIRDSNTAGLTGPLHYTHVKNNDFGNLLKLIYEISMPQQQEGAGGSWGLGKTVYFRLGIGLVLYYSRVKTKEGNYLSRLAACLVEDENKADALLKPESDQPQRGIAWWGQQADDKESTMPITDEIEIGSILKELKVQPYEGDDTGTTIIIPYINEKELLKGSLDSEVKNSMPFWWTETTADYLRVAVQRWYAPRLMNEAYPYGDWLKVKVDGESIKQDKMLPIFKVIQKLYTLGTLKSGKGKAYDYEGKEITVKEVFLRNTFQTNGLAGKIVFTKLNREQLKMNPPENNPNPFSHIFNQSENYTSNPPIISITRKPGMIVGYETAGHWTDDIPKSLPDEYVIGIFVANSSNVLKSNDESGAISLEEYIRKGEKADHTSWNDWNFDGFRHSIIARIQQHVRSAIKLAYQEEKEKTITSSTSVLSRTLADMFLPPEGFGKKPDLSPPGNKKPPEMKRKSANPDLNIDSSFYEGALLKIAFTLHTGRKSDVVRLQLRVSAENGDIQADKWESEDLFGEKFPFEIEDCLIQEVSSKSGQLIEKNNSGSSIEDQYDEIDFKRLYSPVYNICYGLEIQLPNLDGYTIKGELSFRKERFDLKANLSVMSIGSEVI